MKNRIIRLRDPFRTGKAYTVEQAAAITATSPANVRRWLTGYEAPGHRMDPVFGGRGGSDGPLIVSFLELAELIVVVGFRKAGVRLQRLRDAHEYAREAFDLAYPFASLKLQRAGGHVLHEFEQISPGEDKLVVLDQRGQYTLPGVVQGVVFQFDFNKRDTLAVRWFPHGREVPIVVDPRFGGGLPTVRDRGITVDILKKRKRAGEDERSIAEDYALTLSDVKKVLAYAA